MQLQFLENKEKCVSVYFRANSFEFKYNHTLATKINFKFKERAKFFFTRNNTNGGELIVV